MTRKITLISSAAVIIAVLLFIGFANRDNVFTERIKSSLKSAVSPMSNTAEESDLVSIWSDIHRMSHNVIRADEKWGYEDLSLEKIKDLIDRTSIISETEDTGEVLIILYMWEKGDFSSADKDHNYVWTKLGGTVGIATGVDLHNIPQWAKALNTVSP